MQRLVKPVVLLDSSRGLPQHLTLDNLSLILKDYQHMCAEAPNAPGLPSLGVKIHLDQLYHHHTNTQSPTVFTYCVHVHLSLYVSL